MYKLNSILENRKINKLISGFKRSPGQINHAHASDSEIIKLNNELLAISTDSISEEIKTGLYDNPYLSGWMIVTVNISDLAAVGATPIGILISQIIPENISDDEIMLIQKGISDACAAHNTFVLGGDTNEGENLILTGTAIGKIGNKKPVSRIGCNESDIIFSSGKLGSGNAFAISKLISQINSFKGYKPFAQLKYANVINKYASCCMDTSDGLISALDQLMRLNEVGFELNENWEHALDDNSVSYAKNFNVPAWLLFAGQHGEFQLIFTIQRNKRDSFLNEAVQNGLEPIELGNVITETEIKIPIYKGLISLNTAYIRNLSLETNGDVNHYLKSLLEYDLRLKKRLS